MIAVDGAITGQETNIPGSLNKELERGPKEIRSAFLCSFQLCLPDPLPDGPSRYVHAWVWGQDTGSRAYQEMPQIHPCKIAKWTQSCLLCNKKSVYVLAYASLKRPEFFTVFCRIRLDNQKLCFNHIS